MKPSFASSRGSRLSGFTLVELLVVIAIIAILAGVLVAASGPALRAAQRTKAANLATQIQTGALNYYTEYGVYPVPGGSPATDYYISDGTGDKAHWGNLIESLCGNISPYNPSTVVTPNVPNSRNIAFLSLRATDVDSGDAPLNPQSYDSVNHPYFNIGLDNDYSGLVGDTGTPPGSGMPNFATFTQGSPTYLSKGATGGIAVWANCNTSTVAAQWNPAFFVHTY